MKSYDFELKMTDRTPEVKLLLDGELSIKGRSIPENSVVFYDSIMLKLDQLECTEMQVDFFLDYVNSSSSLTLLKLLEKIEGNVAIENIKVNWYYEEDDIDMIELGEIYESKLQRVQFEFHECIDVLD